MRVPASRPLLALLVTLAMLAGCGREEVYTPAELAAFIDVLKANGVDGSLFIRPPFGENMEYVAEYTIARYASTRVVTLFKFRDEDRAEAGLEESLQNDKLSGQARNAAFVMAATFYPPDEQAVAEIRALFLAHRFQ